MNCEHCFCQSMMVPMGEKSNFSSACGMIEHIVCCMCGTRKAEIKFR